MKKEPASAIVLAFLAITSVFCVYFRIYFISHTTILMMGMILGSIIAKHDKKLENWSRKSIKSSGVKI